MNESAEAIRNHVVHTGRLTAEDVPLIIHPVDNNRSRLQLRVGDEVGLTKTGVHFCRLPPETTSTALHWHSHEDEWAYIISAGEDSLLLVREADSTDTQEIPVSTGDFFGFPAGKKTAHAFKTGSSPLVYLFGGSREPSDVCYYPEVGQRLVVNLSDPNSNWLVKDEHVISRK